MLRKLPIDNFVRKYSIPTIAEHVLATSYIVDPILSFKVLLRNANQKLWALNKVMLIRLHNPIRCSQNILTQSVQLPWYWLSKCDLLMLFLNRFWYSIVVTKTLLRNYSIVLPKWLRRLNEMLTSRHICLLSVLMNWIMLWVSVFLLITCWYVFCLVCRI